MNFIKPLQIEDVFSVQKAKLENAQHRIYLTKRKEIKLGVATDQWAHFRIRLEPVNDGFHINFMLFYDYTELQLGINLEFAVESASVRVKVIEPSTPLRAGFGIEKREERSTKLCSLVDLMNEERGYFNDGHMKINMKATIMQKQHEQLPNGLASMLWERDDRDFIIEVGKEDEQKVEFKIHRLILATRSSVFDRMLQSDMKERHEGRVKIVDFAPHVIEIVIAFCYERDNLENLDYQALIEILQFADKYDMVDLKLKLERLLVFRIYPDTICEIANASISSNSTLLKDMCADIFVLYIKKDTPFENADILDKDFSLAAFQKASRVSKN